jgi:type IV secretory pathway VirB10-like protein
MAMTPTPPPEQAPGQANVRQQYQKPEGAIPIERVKRVAVAGGLLVLAYLTIWGSCHRQPSPVTEKKTGGVLPMAPENIDAQQGELVREMDEAKRAAQEAEFAKQRAQAVLDNGGPRQGQADAAEQLRKQLVLDDIRRAHTAPYASTVAFARQQQTSPNGPNDVEGHGQEHAGPPAPAIPPAPPETRAPANASVEPYRLDEGTVIETVLLNRLDGEFVGPVITQVSADVYSRSGLHLLVPKGSRLLGEAHSVQSFDQRRLAIVFHKAILPNGKEISFDKLPGVDQIGETGVVSKVDHHYLEIFGTSLALGAIGGLSQIGAYGGAGYDPSTGFRIGFTERMGSASEQVLSKFLNKVPTIKVLEGTRIKVVLTSDLNLEAYE